LLAFGLMARAGDALGMRAADCPLGAGAPRGHELLGFTGYYLLLVLAIRDAGTEVPTLIIGTIPVWVMLLGKPEHLRWAALAAGPGAHGWPGLALMMSSPHAGSANTAARTSGVAWRWHVASMVSWTAFAIFNSAWLKRHPEVNATDWANWLGVATGLGALVLWLVAGTAVMLLLLQA
jgi:hypothetical protein